MRASPRTSRPVLAFAALALVVLACPTVVWAQVALPSEFVDGLVADSLSRPVNFDFLPDGRVLVVEQVRARIRVIVPGLEVQPGPVGTIADVRTERVDQGLLGIAVDPRWPASPYVYVHSTSESGPNIRITRYAVGGDLDGSGDGALLLDSLSSRDVLADLPDDVWLHNGGTIEFGPDDLLYVALGDDGIPCFAQDIHQMRGKILRLDVRAIPDGPGPAPSYATLVPPGNPFEFDADPRTRLVWHFGLRNPWTFDFDPHTGRMAIADVGEAEWEEINVVSEPGRNFGWPLFEGPELFLPSCVNPDLTTLTMPSHHYGRDSTLAGLTVVLGGICHRADDVTGSFPPDYWGNVFYYDFYNGRLKRIVEVGGAWVPADPVPGQPDAEAWGTGFEYVPRMRFGPDGGLWYVQNTELRRIEYQGLVAGPGPIDPGAGGRGRLELAAYPSPAAGPVAFEFRLAMDAAATLEIFDVAGRRVRRLAAGHPLSAGPQRLTWDGRDDAGARARPGVYLAQLRAGADRARRRVVLLAPG